MSDWDSTAPPSADVPWEDTGGANEMEAPSPAATTDLITLSANPDPRDLKDRLIALFNRDQARIDASAVEKLSGPAMQVLLVAMQDALRDGRKLSVLSPSFAFTLSFEAYGLGGSNEPFTVEYT